LSCLSRDAFLYVKRNLKGKLLDLLGFAGCGKLAVLSAGLLTSVRRARLRRLCGL
jgi:hypothetical protein